MRHLRRVLAAIVIVLALALSSACKGGGSSITSPAPRVTASFDQVRYVRVGPVTKPQMLNSPGMSLVIIQQSGDRWRTFAEFMGNAMSVIDDTQYIVNIRMLQFEPGIRYRMYFLDTACCQASKDIFLGDVLLTKVIKDSGQYPGTDYEAVEFKVTEDGRIVQ